MEISDFTFGAIGEASGQKSNLVQRIKGITDQYPTGTPIYKELIQNADDAGAQEVVFCLDKRSHSPAQLADPELTKYLGPAILFYNNSNFSDGDWEAILDIGNSSKQKETLVTGKFGEGFCSVFNITDLPSIASGTRLQFLDPQVSLQFVKLNPGEPGVKIPFGKPECSKLKLFEPYRFCGFDPSRQFDGTVMRLPLRASPSKLSKVTFSVGQIKDQLEKFAEEAADMLLFLRCVKSIKIMEWENTSNHPVLLYECKVEGEKAVRGSSEIFYNRLKEWNWKAQDDAQCVFDVTKKIRSRRVPGEPEIQNWIVCSTLSPPSDTKDLLPNHKDRKKLVPLTGIAARTELSERSAVQGKVFCGLPLPISTHLPVHINARFAITRDRTGIPKENHEKAPWNRGLLSKALPETYLRTLSSLAEGTLCSLFPVSVADEYLPILQGLYSLLPSSCAKLAPITNKGGKTTYAALQDVYLLDSSENSNRIAQILGHHDIPVCTVPERIHQLLLTYCPNLRFMTRDDIRGFFLKDQFSVEDCLYVLNNYCDDISTENVHKLYGLYILPTAPLFRPEEEEDTKRRKTSCTTHSSGQHGEIAVIDPTKAPYYYCEESKLYNLLRRFSTTSRTIISNKVPKYILDCLVNSATNIKNIGPTTVADMVALLLPVSTNNTMLVDAATYDWILRLWKDYLVALPQLKYFDSVFLLPGDGETACLGKMTVNSSFFVRKSKDESVPDAIVDIIRQLGCSEVFQYSNTALHNDLFTSRFVCAPNALGILSALKVALGHFDVLHEFENVGNDGKAKLLSFLSSIQNIPKDLLVFMSKLPIFRNHTGNYTTVARFVPPPAGEIPVDLLSGLSEFLDIPQASIPLARELGAKDISEEQFYVQFVFPRIETLNSQVRDAAMLRLLRKLPESSDKNVKDQLKQLKFVPTLAGTLCSPLELYDPSEIALQKLLGETYFPCSSFASDDILVYLRQLGLKKLLTRTHLLKVANNVGSQEQAKLLLNYINNNHHESLLSDSSLCAELCKIQWMPVLLPDKLYYPQFPHRNSAGKLQAPHQTRSADKECLVSHNYFLLDGIFNVKLQHKFGWAVSPNDILKQLSCLAGLDVQSAESEKIEKIAEGIYSYLDTHMQDIDSSIVDKIRDMEFVFVRKTLEFVSAGQLTFSSRFPSVRPYLLTVPQVYAKFDNLWQTLDVAESISEDQLLDLLERISKSDSISTSAINLAVEVVNYLAECKHLSQEQKDRVLIPTSDDKLVMPSKCVGDIMEKGLPVYLSNAGFLESHHKISLNAAQKFGVKSLGAAALACKRVRSNMRSFGQRAGLVNSIKQIIQDYPEDSVLLELIQNADDAGATEIHFVHDMRQHPTQQLLGKSMEKLQGESLLVYNNKPFSTADFYSIAEISAASKLNDPKKTGKFGRGFVSTYHLTDTPSFISQDQFCVFDPLRNSVPDATSDEPGVRCTLDPVFVADFADQFSPFSVFGCHPGTLFAGTIFRFPLRTSVSDLKSSIANIKKLLDELNCGSFLLFLKNITKVTVSQYEGDDQKMIFEISKEVKHNSPQADRLVDSITPSLVADILTSSSDTYASSATEETIKIRHGTSTDVISQRWLVCSNISAHSEVANFLQSHTGKRVPWGGVAALIGEVVTSAQAFCFLPLNIQAPFATAINGFFDVLSNRQAIIGHQSYKGNDESCVWNGLLIQHAIAPAYISLLQAAANLLENGQVDHKWYTSLFPDVPAGQGFWSVLADTVYSLIDDNKIIPVNPEHNVVGQETSVMQPSYTACMHGVPELVVRFVVNDGHFTFTTLPRKIAAKIPKLAKFDAAVCCQLLKQYAGTEDDTNFGLQGANSTKTVLNNEQEVLALFDYCYLKRGAEIMGLPLFPLASNNIGNVGSSVRFLHLASDLFPTRPDIFLAPSAVTCVSKHNITPEVQSQFKLLYLGCQELEANLHHVLPDWWKGELYVQWDRSNPTREWLNNIWSFMQRHNDFTTLKDWPLIPTRDGLVQLSAGKKVLLIDEKCPAALSTLLYRAGCHIYEAEGDNFKLDLLSTPDKPEGVCRALNIAEGIDTFGFNATEAEILRGLLQHVKPTFAPVIKMLRIFPDNKGDLVAIGNQLRKAITVKAEIELENDEFLVVLDDTCKKLYQICDVTILSVNKFHNDILENWDAYCGNLADNKKFECIDIIRESVAAKIQKDKAPKKTIQLLKGLAFVNSDKEDEPPKKAEDLYSPFQTLFAAAFEPGEGHFPAKEYCNAEWIEFLSEIGLKNCPFKAPITAVEHCAESLCEKIEQFFEDYEGDSPEFHVELNKFKSRSKLLMEHMAAELRESEKLKALEYAVVDQEATSLPGYVGATAHFTSYQNAVSQMNLELVWLNKPSLINNGFASPLLKTPTTTEVVDNLLEFCNNPVDWTHDELREGKLKKLLANIYKHLSHRYSLKLTDEEEIWERLRDEKWLLVEDENRPVFAAPSDVFGSISMTFTGYFYKNPFPEICLLLKGLGMEDEPSYQQICDALAHKEQTLNGIPLDPNEFTTTRKLLKCLAAMYKPEDNDSVIYAPDNQRVLCNISQLVVNDTPAIFQNIDPKLGKIRFLCKFDLVKAYELGAQSLVNIVKISPNPDQLGEKKINVEFTQKINSEDFVNCVTRIVCHEQGGNISYLLAERVKALRGVKVLDCQCIVNQYICDGTDITNIEAQKPQLSGVNTQLTEIYLSANHGPATIALDVTERLNEVMKGAVKKESMLTRLLQTEPQDLVSVCDTFNIPVLTPLATIVLGEILTQHDQVRIRENPLFTFKAKEYVAWYDNTVHRYGRIKAVEAATTPGRNATRVIISTRYKVETGHGRTQEMGVIQLFKFSPSEQDSEAEAESENQLQLILSATPDEYFSQATQEERELVAERIYKATIDNEKFKKDAGAVDSFVSHQLSHITKPPRTEKLRLSNNNNNNNNNNNDQDESMEDTEERGHQQRLMQQWRQEHDYRSAVVNRTSNTTIDLDYAKRAILQLQYP